MRRNSLSEMIISRVSSNMCRRVVGVGGMKKFFDIQAEINSIV